MMAENKFAPPDTLLGKFNRFASNVEPRLMDLLGKDLYEIFKREIKKEYNLDHDPYRMYVNLFTPGEQPFWHRDGKTGLTFLYYPNLVWEPNFLGETQFMIEGEIRGIVPKPNRLVGFDANLLHRATTFRKDHRFTIAIKFYG